MVTTRSQSAKAIYPAPPNLPMDIPGTFASYFFLLCSLCNDILRKAAVKKVLYSTCSRRVRSTTAGTTIEGVLEFFPGQQNHDISSTTQRSSFRWRWIL